MAQPTVFSSGVKWLKIEPTNVVPDPMHDSGIWAPTVPEGKATQALKYDFVQIFDRPPFVSTVDKPLYDWFKQKKLHQTTKKLLTEKIARKKGCPNLEFLEKHNLDVESNPSDWFKAFVPDIL